MKRELYSQKERRHHFGSIFSGTYMSAHRARQGFSLIEVLVAITIFAIISTFVYLSYANILDVIGRTHTHTLASSLINKQVEFVRNLPYDSVGIVGGAPVGVLPASTSISYEGQQFVVSYFVRNIDNSFDGSTGGSPNDTAPADYRLVELQVTCPSCFNFVPVVFTTWVAPQNLESSTQNGSLFVNVFDANGIGIGGVTVLVRNTSTTPAITISDTTNNSGTLQLVDIATSTNSYQVTVSKTGYTSAQTYLVGAPSNPNPVQPHATVASQQVTSVSFAIDRVSSVAVKTQDQFCQAVGGINFTQNGQKLIGASPNVLEYSQAFSTDSGGQSNRSGLGWDIYSFTNTDSSYDVAGSSPLVPLTVDPNTNSNVRFLVEPKTSTSLLVTVTASSSPNLADVLVNIAKTGFSSTMRTGEKVYTRTDWASGQYAAQDGNIDDNSPAGELHLIQTAGMYPTSTNSFVESDSVDFGTSTAYFHDLSWTPVNQPTGTTLKLQLATANASTGPWSYTGPDGTSGTYYTATSTLSTQYDGKQFLRYKAYFDTTDPTVTPGLQDISLSFASGCVPSAQAFFGGIGTGTYTITATKAGFQTATSSITVGSGWQEVRLNF